MSNADVNLVIEPWTTANTHFNLIVKDDGSGTDALFAEYAGTLYPLAGNTPFINMIFNGSFDPDGGQTGNLVFNIKTPGYSFRKKDNGIQPESIVGDFDFSARLVKQTTCIVTLSLVESEEGNFRFNFDLKNNNGGKDHVFDPDIDVTRPPNPHR